MSTLTTKQQLRILASVGKLRRQLKHAHFTNEKKTKLDDRWKTITSALVVLLRQLEAAIAGATGPELLDKGDFTKFISMISDDEPFSGDSKDNVVAFVVHFRAIEREYIVLIQEWRERHPKKSGGVNVRIYFDVGEFYRCTNRSIDSSDLYAIVAYSTDDPAAVLCADKFSASYSKFDSQRYTLTKQECRNIGIQHPALATGLYR